jgi:hypothetical protein
MFTKFNQAFERAITCDHLADAIREHTQALREHIETFREHTDVLREHSAALLTKASTLDTIEASAKFLADAQRRALQRSGHPHEF